MKNLIIIILLLPTFIFSQNKKEEKKAVKSAINWLTQIDNNNYMDSWDSSGKYFQNQIQKDRWSATLTASRLPLGKLISKRKLKSSEYKTELPGVPDAKYYIFSFDVSYENKNRALETVTLVYDSEGMWKVVGFFIK
tara:strand:- start:223 stop:633 length:411 start_codon:yes stop_codon:yes gene_type:complete